MTSLGTRCQTPPAVEQSDLAYEALLSFADLVSRTIANRLMSPVNRLLYLSLIDLYPGILQGERTAVQVWQIREHAGWPAKASSAKFMQDLQAIGAFQYDSGKYDPRDEERIGYITPNPEIFPYPENFNTKDVEKRRLAREADEKRRKQFKNPLQLLQCEECGSNNLVYDATARCLDCKHVHAPINSIPASMITIEAEVIELADDPFFDDSPTLKVPVTPIPLAVHEELPQTPVPSVVLGKHSRGWICDQCGQADKFVTIPTSWGGTMEICTCSE